MSDEELVRRVQQGERELLDVLIEKYYRDIFGFCYYRTGNEQTAYDCTQETFLRMLRFMDNCREARKFKSYLLRIALNVCRDDYRTNSDKIILFPDEEESRKNSTDKLTDGFRAEDGRKAATASAEDKYVIQYCLMRLPEFQREVIVLHFYYGYKLREIASITGVSLPTAKSRLKQGLDKLKKIFREEGIGEEDW